MSQQSATFGSSHQRAPVSTSSLASTTTEDNFLQQLDVVVSQLQRRNPTGYPLTFPSHLIGHEDEYTRVEAQHRASRLVLGGTTNTFLAGASAQRNNSPTSRNGPHLDATLSSFSHPGGLFFEGSSSPSAACPPQPTSHEDHTIAWLLSKTSSASTTGAVNGENQHGKNSTNTVGLPPSVACHLSATLQRSAVALDRLSPSVTLSASFAKYLEKSEGAIRRERDRRQSRLADGSRVRVSKEGQLHAMDGMKDEDLEKYYLYNGFDEGEGDAGDDNNEDESDENKEEKHTNNKGQGFAIGKDVGAGEAALLTPLRAAPQSSSSLNDGSGQQQRGGGRGNDIDLGQWWLYFNTLKTEGADLLENITSLVSDLEQMQRATTAVTVQSNALSENASTLLARKAELERTSSALSAVLQHFAAMDDCYRAAHHPGLSASNPNFAKLLDDVEDSIAFLTSVSIPASRVLVEKRKEQQDSANNIINGSVNTNTTAAETNQHHAGEGVDEMEGGGGGQNNFYFRPIEFKSAKTFTNRMASVHQMLVTMLKDSLNASFEAAAGAVVVGSTTTATATTAVAERSKFMDPALLLPPTDHPHHHHLQIDPPIPKELALIWQKMYAENAYLRCFTSPQRAMAALQQRGGGFVGALSSQAYSGLSTFMSGGNTNTAPKPEAAKVPTPVVVVGGVGGASAASPPPNALTQHSHTALPHPHLPILSEEQRRQQQINAAVAAANEAAAKYMDEKVTAMLQPLLLLEDSETNGPADEENEAAKEKEEGSPCGHRMSAAVSAAASEASAELSLRLREALRVINTDFSAYVTDVVSAAAAGHTMERQQQQQPSQSQSQSNPNRHPHGYGSSQYNVVPTGPSAAALRRVFEARCPRAFRESLPHLLGCTNSTAEGGGKMSSSSSSYAFSSNKSNAPTTGESVNNNGNNDNNSNNPILALEMSLFEETMGNYSRVRTHLIGPIIRDHLESFAEACRRVLSSSSIGDDSDELANSRGNEKDITAKKGNAPNSSNSNNMVVEVLRNALQLGSTNASFQLLLQKGGGGNDERQLIMLSLIAERTVAVLRDVLLEENALYESLWLPAAAAASASSTSSSTSVVMTLCPALVNDISDAAYQFYRSFVVQTDSFSSLAMACSYFLSVLVAGCSSSSSATSSENRHNATPATASTGGHGRLDGLGGLGGEGDALLHVHVGTLLSCLLGSESVLPAAILSRSAATTAAIGTALFVQQEAQQRVASLLLHERRRTSASGPTTLSPTTARRSPLSVSSLFQRSSPTAGGHGPGANTNTNNVSSSAAASSLVINSTGGVSLANKATGGGAKGEDKQFGSNNKSGLLLFGGGGGGASSSALVSDSTTTTSASTMGPLVLIRMLQDTQERLVFRCSLHLRHEIGGHKNDPREAVLLLRLNLLSTSSDDNSLSSPTAPAVAVVLQDMPSVVVKGVAFMNLLFPVVDEKVFNLFAEECMRMLRASIVVSGNEIARLSTERVQTVFAEVLASRDISTVPTKTASVAEVGMEKSIKNDHQQGKASGQLQAASPSSLLLAPLKESVAKDLKQCPIALHSMLSQLRSLLQLRELITRYPSAFAVPTTEKRFDLAALVLKRRFDVTTKTIDVKRDIEEDIRSVCESIIEAASGLCWGAFSAAESSLSRRPILPPMPQMMRSPTPAVAVGGSAAAAAVVAPLSPLSAAVDRRHGQTMESNNTTTEGLNDEPTTPSNNQRNEDGIHHQASPTTTSPTATAILSSPLPPTPPTLSTPTTIGAALNPLDACTSQLTAITNVMRRYIDNAATRAVILRPIRELTCEKSGAKIAMSSLLPQNE